MAVEAGIIKSSQFPSLSFLKNSKIHFSLFESWVLSQGPVNLLNAE